MAPDLVLLGVAASAGVTTFFSPCSVGLIPAYAGYFVGLEDEAHPTWTGSGAAGAGFGAAAGAGVLAVVLAAGLAVSLLRAVLPVPQARVGGLVRGLAVGVALAVVALGLLMLAGRGPRLDVPLEPPRRRTPAAMAGFGVLFAVASMGCTLPVFLGVLAVALPQGPAGALLTFLAYGLGLAGATLASGAALGLATDRAKGAIRGASRWTRPVGGLLLVGGGAYVLAYYLLLGP